jgi:transposase
LLDTFQSYKMTMREVIMSRKRYPDEFKMEAVKQVIDRGHSVADVAGRLGMTTHSLYAWIKKYGPDSVEHDAKTDDQAEIRRLKKELKRTTEERDLLKKAAVYFANQGE